MLDELGCQLVGEVAGLADVKARLEQQYDGEARRLREGAKPSALTHPEELAIRRFAAPALDPAGATPWLLLRNRR